MQYLEKWAQAPIVGLAVVTGWAAGGQPYEDRTIKTRIVFFLIKFPFFLIKTGIRKHKRYKYNIKSYLYF